MVSIIFSNTTKKGRKGGKGIGSFCFFPPVTRKTPPNTQKPTSTALFQTDKNKEHHLTFFDDISKKSVRIPWLSCPARVASFFFLLLLLSSSLTMGSFMEDFSLFPFFLLSFTSPLSFFLSHTHLFLFSQS